MHMYHMVCLYDMCHMCEFQCGMWYVVYMYGINGMHLCCLIYRSSLCDICGIFTTVRME